MSKISHIILSFLYHGISNNIHNFITIFTDKKLNTKDIALFIMFSISKMLRTGVSYSNAEMEML